MSTMSLLACVSSAPSASAIATSAPARTGASLTPSPTASTRAPAARKLGQPRQFVRRQRARAPGADIQSRGNARNLGRGIAAGDEHRHALRLQCIDRGAGFGSQPFADAKGRDRARRHRRAARRRRTRAREACRWPRNRRVPVAARARRSSRSRPARRARSRRTPRRRSMPGMRGGDGPRGRMTALSRERRGQCATPRRARCRRMSARRPATGWLRSACRSCRTSHACIRPTPAWHPASRPARRAAPERSAPA